jgi:nitroimidazol reductase NimA-like FMN-containing flavoprotein (pyridoxamine 5'-phosphate oxidase superfamily)
MTPLRQTERSAVRRHPERGSDERALAHAILDEALVCHLGYVHDGAPVVIPTAFVRVGDELIVHGAPGGRALRALAAGSTVCCTVTLTDGLVLARSAMHHSMNYRAVVAFGAARAITDPDEKRAALHALVEKIHPGRSAVARPPDAQELAATAVLAIPLDEASVKVREGGPLDRADDLTWPCDAGVIPLTLQRGAFFPMG